MFSGKKWEKPGTKLGKKGHTPYMGMCYNIIVQSWTIAKGAVLEAECSFKTAPFVVPITMERR
jgi:hypothetical protein